MKEVETSPAPPDHFPMGLEEYAATVNLDPMLAAALAVYVPQQERLQTEWNGILESYRSYIPK